MIFPNAAAMIYSQGGAVFCDHDIGTDHALATALLLTRNSTSKNLAQNRDLKDCLSVSHGRQVA
jgi:tRNA A22 N-methylase